MLITIAPLRKVEDYANASVVTICVGTLSYSFSFRNQTDHGDKTKGLKREGLKMER
jgi:hypothetical protein